jgi:AcrR family transcriptional regulator
VAVPRVDGRVDRGDRNRRALVEAIVALIDEGELKPSVAQIAERAGVSERSVFRHFDDVAGLHRAAADLQLERIAPLVVDTPPDGPLAGRIERFTARRAVLLEANSHVRRAADLREPFYPELRRILDQARWALRRQIEVTFAPELDVLEDRDRALVAHALDLATCWDAWEHLRQYQGVAEDEALAVLRRTVTALLAARPPDRVTS